MTSAPHALVVVGAGPAGLCVAGAARARGVEAVVVEASDAVGGAWRHIPGDLRCLSPRVHDLLPDGTFPAGHGVRATAAEVLRWATDYATREAFDIRFGVTANGLREDRGVLRLVTTDGELATRRLVVATGEFGRPRIPELPGADAFAGVAEHSRHCDPASVREGERVVLVGTGNSAVDLLPRLLARGADLVVSARTSPTRPEGLPTGAKARVLWEASAIPVRLLPPRLRCTDTVPVVDPDLYDAIASGRVREVGETVGLETSGVRVVGGELVPADRVVWATGFRRDIAWLDGLTTDPLTSAPAHREGVSTDVRGLGFLGLPCMRTRRSGFLRGFADDAKAVLAALD